MTRNLVTALLIKEEEEEEEEEENMRGRGMGGVWIGKGEEEREKGKRVELKDLLPSLRLRHFIQATRCPHIMPTVIGRLTKQVLYGALFLYFGNKPNSLTAQQPTSMPCYIRHKTSACTHRHSACFN